MGAFGELLEQYFGGSRHDVKTWGTQKEKIKKEPTEEILLEEDEEVYNKVKETIEDGVKTFFKKIEHLHTVKSKELFKTEKYQNQFDEWREEFFKK